MLKPRSLVLTELTLLLVTIITIWSLYVVAMIDRILSLSCQLLIYAIKHKFTITTNYRHMSQTISGERRGNVNPAT